MADGGVELYVKALDIKWCDPEQRVASMRNSVAAGYLYVC
jgi:hypothetical protein